MSNPASAASHGCCVDRACNERTCMALPAGKTCADCARINWCLKFFGPDRGKETSCDWFPRRFAEVKP